MENNNIKFNIVKCPYCYMRTLDIFMVNHLYYKHNIKMNDENYVDEKIKIDRY